MFDNMYSRCRSAAVIAGAVLILLGMTALAFFATRMGGKTESAPSSRRKTYRQTIAEGVKINRHGLYGIDLVSCDSCSLKKRKHGIFTIGALNVLVIDNLTVVLPRAGGSEADSPGGTGEDSDAMSLARRMGVSDGFLATRGIAPKFSGLRINGLSVSRLSEDGKPEPAFLAKSAEAVLGGLKLTGCVVHEGSNPPHPVSGAMLNRKGGKLSLVWNGGSMDLN